MILLAIGNASRGDDALGWAFADAIEALGTFPGTIEYRYQLQVEDADLIREFDEVYFVDATKEELSDGFAIRPCPPDPQFSFSTHAITPGSIMALVHELYPDQIPMAQCVIMSGYQWELDQPMSSASRQHLHDALGSFELKSKVKTLSHA